MVAALKAAGRSDEARLVAKRKRPSASVWAVNQLARQAGEELAALLAMGESLRKGERALLRGGDAAGFMEEARAARQKVAALVRRAERIVEEGGQKATVTLGRKIAATLQAASIGDDETRARLEAGRIDEDSVAAVELRRRRGRRRRSLARARRVARRRQVEAQTSRGARSAGQARRAR